MLTSFSQIEFHLAGLTEPFVILCSSSDHSICGRLHGPRELHKTLRRIYSDYQKSLEKLQICSQRPTSPRTREHSGNDDLQTADTADIT